MKRSTVGVATICGIALMSLAACGSMSGLDGGSRYACQAPTGVACDSVSGVYANTVARSPTATSPPASSRAVTSAAEPSGASREAGILAGTMGVATAEDGADRTESLPLRLPPRVLRLWIRPWEDSDGDLHDQAYSYVQIDSGRWRTDHVEQLLRQAAMPIRPPSGSGAADRPSISTPVRSGVNQRPPAAAMLPPSGSRP